MTSAHNKHNHPDNLSALRQVTRTWVRAQSKAGQLPFMPDSIGSHWSSRLQVDVVALNWQTHDILLGECKWGADRVDRQIVRELIERKTPLVDLKAIDAVLG